MEGFGGFLGVRFVLLAASMLGFFDSLALYIEYMYIYLLPAHDLPFPAFQPLPFSAF